jgi:ParB/RepB/Spo0J family partition protein
MQVVSQPVETENQTDEYYYLDLLRRAKIAIDTGVDVAMPASQIRPYEGQPRKYFNPESTRRLSDSIHSSGQMIRGMIRRNPAETEYELIDGERRWRAVQMIPEDVQPDYRAFLIEADDDVVRYLISGIANFNREGHTAMEIANTIHQLLDFKLPLEKIAILLNVSEHWARQMHGLVKLVPEVQEMLHPARPKKEILPIVAAIHISKAEPRLQKNLAERVLRGEVSVSRLRGEVVQVSKREGAHIRLRVASPFSRWESFANKVRVIGRTTGDAEDLVTQGDLKQIIKAHPRETAKQLREIREAKEVLNRLEKMLVSAS